MKISAQKMIFHFLVDLLDNKNNEIKINAARALIKIGKSGLNSLNNHVEAVGYPLNEMVMQIKGELAAWSWQTFILHIFTYGILLYSLLLMTCYILIGIFSISETRRYLHKNSFTDYRVLASSDELPSFSILAPAYNEGSSIIENVRSLLSLHYNKLEVIIINDGSKDDSLEKLIKAYDLHKVDYFVNERIKTKKVRGVYKSYNPVYRKLISG